MIKHASKPKMKKLETILEPPARFLKKNKSREITRMVMPSEISLVKDPIENSTIIIMSPETMQGFYQHK